LFWLHPGRQVPPTHPFVKPAEFVPQVSLCVQDCVHEVSLVHVSPAAHPGHPNPQGSPTAPDGGSQL
jgi:hypothetical protein